MNFKAEADKYARFLGVNNDTPAIFGRWLGGFMMMAHDNAFYGDPYIWSPKDGAAKLMARVYFTPWSQNNMPAIRHLPDRFFFCAMHRKVLAKSDYGPVAVFDRQWRASNFSGAQTRARFEKGREGFRWLSAQLA